MSCVSLPPMHPSNVGKLSLPGPWSSQSLIVAYGRGRIQARPGSLQRLQTSLKTNRDLILKTCRQRELLLI